MMIQAGTPAPGFILATDSGTTVSLSDFRGQTVVLYFYPKDMTPGCTQEACDFRDASRLFAKRGAIVLGVSRDSVASHQKFKEKHRLNFPLLADVDGKTCEAYGVWQEKSLYGRKFMGIVRATFVIGPDGVVKAVFPKVKVSGHVEDVLAAIDGRAPAEPSRRSRPRPPRSIGPSRKPARKKKKKK